MAKERGREHQCCLSTRFLAAEAGGSTLCVSRAGGLHGLRSAAWALSLVTCSCSDVLQAITRMVH